MPLSTQEQGCVDLVLPALGELYGGAWRIPDGPTLDDLHASEASPECLVTDGSISAAIEVKRLTGDTILQGYSEALRSLKRSLVPSRGGRYTLSPAVDFRLPIDGSLRRLLKKEIERVAPTLIPGGPPGAVRVPRTAYVSMLREAGPGCIRCYHDSTGKFVTSASPLVSGVFQLVDEGMLEHNFVTDAGREAFHAALAEACRTRVENGSGEVEWFEEWELWRGTDLADDDPRDRDGVHVICVTEAREVSASVAEALDIVLEKALRKFVTKWADRHVIVLDKASVLCNAERVREALSWVTPEELANVDLVLLTDDDEFSIVWRKGAETLPI